MSHGAEIHTAAMDDEVELDFSGPSGDEEDALSRDRVTVRSMQKDDLPALLAIDRAINSGTCRSFIFVLTSIAILNTSCGLTFETESVMRSAIFFPSS